MTDNFQRRTFLRVALMGATLAPALGLLGEARAAAPLPLLDPADPTAKALGYVADATKVDAKANPTFKAGQHCASCVQYQGKATDKAAACPIYPGKQVHGAGWCKVWAQKPA